MDHDQLIAEFSRIQQLSTRERLKLARKRRLEQLSRYHHLERHQSPGSYRGPPSANPPISPDTLSNAGLAATVKFADSVVLREAAARGDLEEVKRLLVSGVDPNSTNEDGLTALHQCCVDNAVDMVSLLLRHGAAIDARDCELWTPLHAAAISGHLNIVSQLIQMGADLLALNMDGSMAYDLSEGRTLEYIENQMALRSITQEQIDEVRAESETSMLEDMRTRSVEHLELRGNCHETPMHVAAANNYISVLKLLIERGAAVNPADIDNWLPIHAAACWGHLEALEILFENGGDIEAITFAGETVGDLCEHPMVQERVCEMLAEVEYLRRHTRFDATNSSSIRRNYHRRSTKRCVRRLSMRDKNLTKKQDALQEVEIRQSRGQCGLTDVGTASAEEGAEFSPSAPFTPLSSERESQASMNGSSTDPVLTPPSPAFPAQSPCQQLPAKTSSQQSPTIASRESAHTISEATLPSNGEHMDRVQDIQRYVESANYGVMGSKPESDMSAAAYCTVGDVDLASAKPLSLSDLKLLRRMDRCRTQLAPPSGVNTETKSASGFVGVDSAVVSGPYPGPSDQNNQPRFSSKKWYRCCSLL